MSTETANLQGKLSVITARREATAAYRAAKTRGLGPRAAHHAAEKAAVITLCGRAGGLAYDIATEIQDSEESTTQESLRDAPDCCAKPCCTRGSCTADIACNQ